MMSRRSHQLALLLALLAVTQSASALGAQDGPPVPKPGPEMAVLKHLEGTWDAAMKMSGAPQESKGTMTCTMECGGLWLASSFQGDFGGLSFQGKGLDSYDQTKKKYVAVWVDSMSTAPMIMEGSYDKAKRQLTMVADYPGMDGKLTRHTMVTRFVDKDHHEWTMSTPNKEGKETVMLTIKYTRKQ